MIHFPGLPKDYPEEKKDKFDRRAECEEGKTHEARMTMWEALQMCHNQGKIKHLGVSNFTEKHFEPMFKDSR